MTQSFEEFFARTVAAGWAPRHPCTDPAELEKLETSPTRGDCISPLIQDGDTVYIDRNMKPEPGDVVQFALSQRGADAQNSSKAEGRLLDQPTWKRGDGWCKLYGVHHGLDMLYERHGSEATATLMSCESPDGTPVLHPVRNVRRNGRLLFGPTASGGSQLTRRALLLGSVVAPLALAACDGDSMPLAMLPGCSEPAPADGSGASSAAELGVNAATAIYTASLAGPTNVNDPGGTAGSAAFLINSITPTALKFDTSAVVTVTGFMDMNAVAQQNDAYVAVSTSSGLNVGAVASAGGFGARNPSTGLAGGGGAFAIEQTYAVPANTTQTYYLYGAAILGNSGPQAGSFVNVSNVNMKVELITR